MLLGEGEHISADGRLLESTELQVDPSTLTGDLRPVSRITEATLLVLAQKAGLDPESLSRQTPAYANFPLILVASP